MKKVLVIAHQFPPIGGSGVQRTLKFVKYLRDFGYEPVVFTRDSSRAALKDESLLSDIPYGTKIVRTRAYDLASLPGLLKYPGKLTNRVLIPDAEVVWQHAARLKAIEVVVANNIDVIYSTSAPYSDHLLGLFLKKQLPRIPWVCDFRDEWSNNPYLLRRGLRARIERNMEKQVLLKSDCLITNTPVMLAHFVRDYPQTKDKFHVIPNGFDDEDFTGLEYVKPENKKFTLTYTGLFYGRRKPDNFFMALNKAIETGKLDKEKISVQLIGNFKTELLKEKIEGYNLKNIVKLVPYMKHRACLVELVKSDALLLIEPSGPGSEAFYTGKVFEYMNAGRPILASIPYNGAAAQLILRTNTGLVSDFNDIEGTIRNLLYLYNCWLHKTPPLTPDKKEIRKYERKELTKELVKVLDASVEKV